MFAPPTPPEEESAAAEQSEDATESSADDAFVEAEPLEAEPLEAEPLEAAPIEAAPDEATPVEAELVEAEALDESENAAAQNEGGFLGQDQEAPSPDAGLPPDPFAAEAPLQTPPLAESPPMESEDAPVELADVVTNGDADDAPFADATIETSPGAGPEAEADFEIAIDDEYPAQEVQADPLSNEPAFDNAHAEDAIGVASPAEEALPPDPFATEPLGASPPSPESDSEMAAQSADADIAPSSDAAVEIGGLSNAEGAEDAASDIVALDSATPESNIGAPESSPADAVALEVESDAGGNALEPESDPESDDPAAQAPSSEPEPAADRPAWMPDPGPAEEEDELPMMDADLLDELEETAQLLDPDSKPPPPGVPDAGGTAEQSPPDAAAPAVAAIEATEPSQEQPAESAANLDAMDPEQMKAALKLLMAQGKIGADDLSSLLAGEGSKTPEE
jgi:hypothetical protein